MPRPNGFAKLATRGGSPITSAMKKSTANRTRRSAAKAATKSVANRLVAVRKAAQEPVHATRTAIRRAVRSVAEERHSADG